MNSERLCGSGGEASIIERRITLVRENLIKTKINNGEPVLMAFLTTNDTATAEVLALSEIDVVVVDNEHMAFDNQQILNVARTITVYGKACLLRTAVKDLENLSRYMEFGISGFCATQCHGLEDAKKIIDAVKYPPVGKRGLGNDGRAVGYGFMNGMSNSEYMEFANKNTMIFVTLEDMNGINDAEEIAKLKEIDSVHIGPIDLSASMGFGGNSRHPAVIDVIKKTNEKILAAGNTIGQFAPTPDTVPGLVASGSKMLIIGTDIALLRGVYTSYSKALREAINK